MRRGPREAAKREREITKNRVHSQVGARMA
jgi:hypothetical protein